MTSLELVRKLFASTDRVKSLDIHPTQPHVIVSIYTGVVQIWDYDTQSVVKSFNVSNFPVRDAKFITRRSWIICCSDDKIVRVFSLETHEKIISFEAHEDYVRSISVHPTLPIFLTSSDDRSIKLWNWEKNWKNLMTFKGHSDYVMKVTFSPKDSSTFASASVDQTIKFWSISNPNANFTLEGHEGGVNDVDYYQGEDRPLIISGSDDGTIKLWDYQLRICVQTIKMHTHNVSCVAFFPLFPFFISGSEDGTVRLWNLNTYKTEVALNYDKQRVWDIAYCPGKNEIGIAYDKGFVVLKVGKEFQPISMDSSGKLVWSVGKNILASSLRSNLDDREDISDVSVQSRTLGISEFYPQKIIHSENGRYLAVHGGTEFVIYTTLAWRVKAFGKGIEFVWGKGSSYYATRENNGTICIMKDFENHKTISANYKVNNIYGGFILIVTSDDYVHLYSWESSTLIGKVGISAKNIIASETGKLAIIRDEVTYLIDQIASSENGEELNVLSEIHSCVVSGVWIKDLFVFLTTSNRLEYTLGDETHVISHIPANFQMLGYMPKSSRVYFVDRSTNLKGVLVSLPLIECKRLILNGDMSFVKHVDSLSNTQRNDLSRFLESQKMYDHALEITTDNEIKFELALVNKKIDIAVQTAEKFDHRSKWISVGDLALELWDYDLAVSSYKKGHDLLSLLMLYASIRDSNGIKYVRDLSMETNQHNLSFFCNFLLGEFDKCVDIAASNQSLPEAALLAHTYAPEKVTQIEEMWKNKLRSLGKHIVANEMDKL